MKLYVMDAFANRIFGGNQAGVALPDRELSDETMRQIAAEMKHSETAFIHMEPDGSVSLRYFTPAGEVDLCGHATVASFALLRQLEKIGDGDHTAHTKAGELNITVRGGTVWMDMAPPQLIGDIPAAERAALYAAYGLTEADCPEGYIPRMVSTGLADIMMPVRDHETLMRAVQNAPVVTELSRKYDVTGVHMFGAGWRDGLVQQLRAPVRHPGGVCHRDQQRCTDVLSLPARRCGAGAGECVFAGRAHESAQRDTQPSV